MSSDPNPVHASANAKANGQVRVYKRAESAVFFRTKEKFGGLSNMASGFPLRVNGVRILTSEALYQACRFPHLPDVQRLIIQQVSPMTAKMKSKPYREDSRPDWDRVRVRIMRWCLRVKLAQNWWEFSRLLLSTGNLPIVEESRKDDFWGAKVVDSHTLQGMNVLGRLLMELREEIKQGRREQFERVQPLTISNFLLWGEPIAVVEAVSVKTYSGIHSTAQREFPSTPIPRQFELPSLLSSPSNSSLLDDDARHAREVARIDKLKPYSQYKDTQLTWAEKIPSHWGTGPGLAVFREKHVQNKGLLEKTVLSLSYGKIVVKPPEKLHGLVPDSFETYQIVDPGDIIIRSTDLQNDWNSLRIGLVRDRGIITSAYLCFRTTNILIPEYGYQLLHALDLMKVFYGMGSGLRQNLSFLDFKRMSIIVPPPDEQAAIVRFLDYANKRIDQFIRWKNKLVTLLNERKQALIHRLVTHGLDPSSRKKTSGVDWLGSIPEHWRVLRLGRVVRLFTGFPFPSVEFSQDEHAVRLLRGVNVTPSGIRWQDVVRWERLPGDGLDEFELRAGDIVLGMDRPVVRSGVRAAVIELQDTPSLLLQRVACLRPTEDLDPGFLLLLLGGRAFADYIAPIFTGISVPHLSPEQISRFSIAVPPVAEQKNIAAAFENASSKLKIALRQAEEEIELIREYRTRLITDVVTGKLDVREAVRKLPVETEEVETGGGQEPVEEMEMVEEGQTA